MTRACDRLWQWLHYTHLTRAERDGLRASALRAAQGTEAEAAVPSTSSWVSWSLTEILYRRHDPLSRLFALSSFLPLVIVIFLSGLASAPSAERRQPALMLLMFLVLNVVVNVALKSTIRSPRPRHPATLTASAGQAHVSYSTEHGMPSDHAQFTTFFVCYLILRGRIYAERNRCGRRGTRESKAATSAAIIITKRQVCLFLVIDAVVCAGRVYNGYHTVVQVLVGAALGAAMALVCVLPAVQRGMRAVTTRAVTPIMLLCTGWTAAVY